MDSRDILLELLADISNTVDDIDYKGIILGSDLNCNLNTNCDLACLIKSFLQAYNLDFFNLSDFSAGANTFTFRNPVKGCYSIIDYLCISSYLSSSVIKYSVIDSSFNLSDHEPIELIMRNIIIPACGVTVEGNCNDSSKTNTSTARAFNFRFYWCDAQNYYERSRVLIRPFYDELRNVLKI